MANIIRLPRKSGARAPARVSGIRANHWLWDYQPNGAVHVNSGYINYITGQMAEWAGYTGTLNTMLSHSSSLGGVSRRASNHSDGRYYRWTQVTHPYSSNNVFPLTIIYWTYWVSQSVSADGIPICWGRSGGSGYVGFVARNYTGGTGWIKFGRAHTGGPASTSDYTPSDDTFYQYVGMSNAADNAQLYVNGALHENATVSSTSTWTANQCMAMHGGNGVHSGWVSEAPVCAGVWLHAELDAEQIAELYDPNARWDMWDTGRRTISLPEAAAAAVPDTAIRTTRKSGARAPARINGINWASPLAQGLQVAAAPMVGAVRNFATGEQGTLGGNAFIGAGALGRAVDLDGAGDYFTVPNAFNPADTDKTTVCVWFQLRDTSSRQLLTDMQDSGDGGHILQLNVSANQITSMVRVVGGYPLQTTSHTHDTGVHCLIGTYDQVNIRTYLDGAEIGSPTAETRAVYSITAAHVFGIHGNLSSYPTDGLIYHAMHWNRALSAEEIRALYSPQHRWDIYDTGNRTISLPGVPVATTDTVLRKAL